MTKEDLLNDIFDLKWQASSGNRYLVRWCDLCNVFIITHPECHGSTCNSGCCDACRADFEEFNCYKCSVLDYINDEELRIWEKCLNIKKLIGETIVDGDKEINFKKLQKEGKLSRWQKKIFEKELK